MDQFYFQNMKSEGRDHHHHQASSDDGDDTMDGVGDNFSDVPLNLVATSLSEGAH